MDDMTTTKKFLTLDRVLQTIALAFPILFMIVVTIWSLNVTEPPTPSSVAALTTLITLGS